METYVLQIIGILIIIGMIFLGIWIDKKRHESMVQDVKEDLEKGGHKVTIKRY